MMYMSVAYAGTIIGYAVVPLVLSGIISTFKKNNFGIVFGVVSALGLLGSLFL